MGEFVQKALVREGFCQICSGEVEFPNVASAGKLMVHL